MTRPLSIARRLADLAGVFSAAIEASAATNSGRRPSARSLSRLGIDPAVFDRIKR